MVALLRRFGRCDSGNSPVQTAMLFGAIAMALSVLAAPFLQGAASYYADNRAFGIDRVLTGSVEQRDETYTVRRSVLSPDPVRVCDKKKETECPAR